MGSLRRAIAVGWMLCALVGCKLSTLPGATSLGGPDAFDPLRQAGPSAAATAAPGPAGSASVPVPGATVAPITAPLDVTIFSGQVLGLDGLPAPNVRVLGHLVSNNSGSLISHNGSKYRTAAVEPETVTDARGRFRLFSYGTVLNLEAIQTDTVKAIRMQASASVDEVTLRLAPTGVLAGRVTAPDAPTVTNLEGVDVYVPGTGYLAKTNAAGMFAITGMPAATFDVVASRIGLGRASASGIVIQSGKTTQAPDLGLVISVPEISALVPSNGGPGSKVLLRGKRFGASTGEPFLLFIGGNLVTAPRRLDDETIEATVPSGATTGDVVALVGEVPSNPRPFTVLKTLDLLPRLDYLGKGRSQTFRIVARDTRDQLVERPTASWSISAGTAATVSALGQVTGLGDGNVTVTVDSGTVTGSRRLRVETGTPLVNTLAGSTQGFQDGTGTEALFNYPHGIALEPDGNLIVTDRNNHRIRRVTPEGVVTTIVGSGVAGSSDGVGTSAQVHSPAGVVVDPDGIIYVAETGYNKIRKIDRNLNVTTIAGHGGPGEEDGDGVDASFNGPHGITRDRLGNLYVADWAGNRVRKIDPWYRVTTLKDGNQAAIAFANPIAVAVDEALNVYVAEHGACKITKVTPEGAVSTYAGSGQPVTWDSTNPLQAGINWPHGLALDTAGNLYVTEQWGNCVRVIAPTGHVTTVAGGKVNAPIPTTDGFVDGVGRSTQFNQPFGVCVDRQGTLYVTDRNNNRIRRITP